MAYRQVESDQDRAWIPPDQGPPNRGPGPAQGMAGPPARGEEPGAEPPPRQAEQGWRGAEQQPWCAAGGPAQGDYSQPPCSDPSHGQPPDTNQGSVPGPAYGQQQAPEAGAAGGGVPHGYGLEYGAPGAPSGIGAEGALGGAAGERVLGGYGGYLPGADSGYGGYLPGGVGAGGREQGYGGGWADRGCGTAFAARPPGPWPATQPPPHLGPDRPPGPYAGRGPRGYRRSDERITEDINERLTAHPDINAEDIEVHVEQGEVTLAGAVEDRHVRRLVEDVCWEVLGVKEVQDRLRLAPPRDFPAGPPPGPGGHG